MCTLYWDSTWALSDASLQVQKNTECEKPVNQQTVWAQPGHWGCWTQTNLAHQTTNFCQQQEREGATLPATLCLQKTKLSSKMKLKYHKLNTLRPKQNPSVAWGKTDIEMEAAESVRACHSLRGNLNLKLLSSSFWLSSMALSHYHHNQL